MAIARTPVFRGFRGGAHGVGRVGQPLGTGGKPLGGPVGGPHGDWVGRVAGQAFRVVVAVYGGGQAWGAEGQVSVAGETGRLVGGGQAPPLG
ncbi:MAG: hypothetical protein LBL92_00105 [Propionibacteriaceae bacterium]|nr:hypothetical protein [Propionibacteriaceae bacterium]